MDYRYSIQTGKNAAKAVGLALPISLKKSVEVCSFIRGKNLKKSISQLDKASKGEIAIPFRKFNRGGTGHRKGRMGTGRYPQKTCIEITKILKNAAANAEHKGLNPDSLVITHICAKQASKSYHYGRKRRRLMKRTHIEVMVDEGKND
ncbi:50S ribosomal protein L22 [Candidatus Woesearchaeota archaeon]|nr:50S ribosomal protein L22 [Candidatus Woesearchaeota archaeon]